MDLERTVARAREIVRAQARLAISDRDRRSHRHRQVQSAYAVQRWLFSQGELARLAGAEPEEWVLCTRVPLQNPSHSV
jgi:hypothetical protein